MNKLILICCTIILVAFLGCTTPVTNNVIVLSNTSMSNAPMSNAPARIKQLNLSQYAKIEQDRYVISGDEVYDRKTDLTWKRCNYGQTWDNQNSWCKGIIKRVSIDHASSDIEAMKGGWRLPEEGELMSIFEIYCGAEKIKAQEIFPDIKGDEWNATSTPNGESHIMACECFGSKAFAAGVGKQMNTIIRLVHNGKTNTLAK